MNKEIQKRLNADSEDIEDLLKIIEKSYNIRFETNELEHARTFGELSDSILLKIKLQDKEDCTNQQGFYKLREAIEKTELVDRAQIQTKAKLIDIFPRQRRREYITKIEKELDVELNALRPKYPLIVILMIILSSSIVMLFIDWRYGLTGVLFSIIGSWISQKTGIEFKDKTLGELIERMTQLNYVKSRRHSETANKKEIAKKIELLFIENLGLKTDRIERETIIV